MDGNNDPGGIKKKILRYVLIILTIFSAFASWWVLDRAINVADASVWSMPAVCFSAFFIILNLSVVVIAEKRLLKLLIFLVFSMSFLFSSDLSRVFFGLLALLFGFLAVDRIKKDLTLNIRIDLGKSLAAGKTLIVVSLAFLIASQYFSSVRYKPSQAMIPSFGFGNTSGMITSKALSVMYPEYRDINDDKLTVDDFLAQIGKSQLDGGLENIDMEEKVDEMIRQKGGEFLSSEEKDAIRKKAVQEMAASEKEMIENAKNLAKVEGRKRLSEIVGKELTGQERVADVFSEVINSKIISYFQPVMADREAPPLIPVILALILFLTVVPLGNFLTIMLIPVAQLMFHLLKGAGLVETKKVMMEVERLE